MEAPIRREAFMNVNGPAAWKSRHFAIESLTLLKTLRLSKKLCHRKRYREAFYDHFIIIGLCEPRETHSQELI